jgi:hypothetical protein
MAADRSGAACTVAGVRKPSMKDPREMAGGGAASAERYGGLRTTEVREGNRRRWQPRKSGGKPLLIDGDASASHRDRASYPDGPATAAPPINFAPI